MKRFLILVLGHVFIFTSVVVCANGQVNDLIISSISTGPYNGESVVWATLTANHSNPDSCAYPNTILINSSSATYEANLSLLLTAHATGKKVHAYLAGCYNIFGTGVHTYPLVYNLTIE